VGLDAEDKIGAALALSIQEQFGQIDIYVFDQILRGNIEDGMCVVDAGCGYGRNLVHLLRQGCEVFAIDQDADGVEHVRKLAESLGAGLPAENFKVGSIERMPFADGIADVVLSSAVMHFARDEKQFRAMLKEMWRVLKPGGLFFCRLGSQIGMEFERVRENIYRIGDGSEWFLVDERMLLDLTAEFNAVLVDQIKTTVVQDYRCMTTWVIRKRRG
jgi:SAM-dependent methyltransferase